MSSVNGLTGNITIFINAAGSSSGGGGTASTTGLVPYTGAVSGVNLFPQSLTANKISAFSILDTGGLTADSVSSQGITGTTVSASLLLAGNFQAVTAAQDARLTGLETATGNLQTQVGSLWNAKVPYNGATANVNLAAFSFTASSISTNSLTAGSITSSAMTAGSISTSNLVSTSITAGSVSSQGITGTTVSASLLLAGNFQSSTANANARLNWLESISSQVSICSVTTATTVSTNVVSNIIRISRTAKMTVTAVDGGITANFIYNVPPDMRFIFVGGTLTANLPPPIGLGGLTFTIKSNGNPLACTVSALSGAIDGSQFQFINMPYTSITLVSDNTNYFIV